MDTTKPSSPLTFLEGEFKQVRDPDSGSAYQVVIVAGQPHSVDHEMGRWKGREVTLTLHFLTTKEPRPGRGSCLYPAKCALHLRSPQRMMAASLKGLLLRHEGRWVVKVGDDLNNVPLQYMPGHLARLSIIPKIDPADLGADLDADAMAAVLDRLRESNER